jgi:hypothetical protein
MSIRRWRHRTLVPSRIVPSRISRSLVRRGIVRHSRAMKPRLHRGMSPLRGRRVLRRASGSRRVRPPRIGRLRLRHHGSRTNRRSRTTNTSRSRWANGLLGLAAKPFETASTPPQAEAWMLFLQRGTPHLRRASLKHEVEVSCSSKISESKHNQTVRLI